MIVHQTNNIYPLYDTLPRMIEFNRMFEITNLQEMIDEASSYLIKPKKQRPLLAIDLLIDPEFEKELVSIYFIIKDPLLAVTGELFYKCDDAGYSTAGVTEEDGEYGRFRSYHSQYRSNNIYIMSERYLWEYGEWSTTYEPIKK